VLADHGERYPHAQAPRRRFPRPRQWRRPWRPRRRGPGVNRLLSREDLTEKSSGGDVLVESVSSLGRLVKIVQG
jgi:hypothetical protein